MRSIKAKLVDAMPSGHWIYEIKFPEVKDSIAALNIQDATIDGEIVALDEKGRSSFQLLQGLDIGAEEAPYCFLRL